MHEESLFLGSLHNGCVVGVAEDRDRGGEWNWSPLSFGSEKVSHLNGLLMHFPFSQCLFEANFQMMSSVVAIKKVVVCSYPACACASRGYVIDVVIHIYIY